MFTTDIEKASTAITSNRISGTSTHSQTAARPYPRARPAAICSRILICVEAPSRMTIRNGTYF
jgi:hypothetical protein